MLSDYRRMGEKKSAAGENFGEDGPDWMIAEERAMDGVEITVEGVVSRFNVSNPSFFVGFLERCASIALNATRIVKGCAFSCIFPLESGQVRQHIVVCFDVMGAVKRLNAYAVQ